METKPFPLSTTTRLVTRIRMETNTPPSMRSMLLITIPKVNAIPINVPTPIRNLSDHPY
jgi:hypothetical protein